MLGACCRSAVAAADESARTNGAPAATQRHHPSMTSNHGSRRLQSSAARSTGRHDGDDRRGVTCCSRLPMLTCADHRSVAIVTLLAPVSLLQQKKEAAQNEATGPSFGGEYSQQRTGVASCNREGDDALCGRPEVVSLQEALQPPCIAAAMFHLSSCRLPVDRPFKVATRWRCCSGAGIWTMCV
jgi:hypothetical protein